MGGDVDLATALDNEIGKPIPGSNRVSASVAEDEMEMFKRAQAQMGKG